MNERATFSRVERTAHPLYGPRKLLICGYTPEGLAALEEVLAAAALPDLPVVYAGSDDLEETLGRILARPANAGRNTVSRMPAAVIMAGITEDELHRLIARYRSAGLPNPLWATLTPTSENWTLRQLLKELSAERQALEKRPPTVDKRNGPSG
jgi:hypothetical protein